MTIGFSVCQEILVEFPAFDKLAIIPTMISCAKLSLRPPLSTRCAGPRDIYEVDELALREALAEAESAGKHNAHGVASVRLAGLLDQSRQLVMAYRNSKREIEGSRSKSPSAALVAIADVSPRLKIRSDICQRKRREIPKGGVEDWHLSDEERFVRWPGAYLDAGSSLGVRQAE